MAYAELKNKLFRNALDTYTIRLFDNLSKLKVYLVHISNHVVQNALENERKHDTFRR